MFVEERQRVGERSPRQDRVPRADAGRGQRHGQHTCARRHQYTVVSGRRHTKKVFLEKTFLDPHFSFPILNCLDF